jgi:hypothetical protein
MKIRDKDLNTRPHLPRGVALELRHIHLKRQLKPVATLIHTCQAPHLNKVRVKGLGLDVEVSAERGQFMDKLNTGTLWRRPRMRESLPKGKCPLVEPNGTR